MLIPDNITYTAVRNPVWDNAEQTRIVCEVNFDHLDDDWVPFCCQGSGDMEHTHRIYNECVNGDYGTVAAYTAPPDITGDDAMFWLRLQRDEKLKETDWWALPDSPTMTQAQQDYRTALRDLPANSPNATLRYQAPTADAVQQYGYPGDYTLWVNVTWPTKP